MTNTIRTVKKTVPYSFYKNYMNTLHLDRIEEKEGTYHADTKEIDLEYIFYEDCFEDGTKQDVFSSFDFFCKKGTHDKIREKFLKMPDDHILLRSEAIKKLIDNGITRKLILQCMVDTGFYEERKKEHSLVKIAKKRLNDQSISKEQYDLIIDMVNNYYIIDDLNFDKNEYINDMLQQQ